MALVSTCKQNIYLHKNKIHSQNLTLHWSVTTIIWLPPLTRHPTDWGRLELFASDQKIVEKVVIWFIRKGKWSGEMGRGFTVRILCPVSRIPFVSMPSTKPLLYLGDSLDSLSMLLQSLYDLRLISEPPSLSIEKGNLSKRTLYSCWHCSLNNSPLFLRIMQNTL